MNWKKDLEKIPSRTRAKLLKYIYMNDTICAVSTGNASAAVAIVRMSGPQAVDILNRVVLHARAWQPRVQIFCSLFDGKDVLDKALVTYFQAPHSFTGEDVVELAIHGSPYIKGRLLELLCAYGARPARRGEFSLRAFLHGKMDLVEAQAVCDLIASGNQAAHRLAMNTLDGKLSNRLTQLKTTLAELLAQIEVRLDDVDEEMAPLGEAFITQQIQSVLSHIKALAQTFSVGRLIKDGLKVALVGVPNSGKSSLLNALVGFDRAIVSDQSGTTRDTVEETLDVNGQKIILTDTAGIRDHAVDVAEQEGMRRTVRAMEKADVIVWVTDGSLGVSAAEQNLWQQIKEQHKRTLIVRNKIDQTVVKLDLPADAQGMTVLDVSCKSGQGVQELKETLVKDMDAAESVDGVLISNLRHYEALLRAQTDLEEALLQVNAGGEFLAEHIRKALFYLQDLLGEVTPDDVLGIIFSKFCMGK